MRANPFHIIVLATASALTPAAWAHAHKPAPAAKPTKKAAASTRAAKLEKPAKGKHKQAAEPVKLTHTRHARPEPPEPKLVHGRHAKPETPPAKLVRGHQPAPAPVKLLAKATPLPAPEPEPEQEPIHVSHDRHQHFAPADQAPEEPRKATSADFMTIDLPPAQALPQPKPATIIRTSPTAGVVVGSKVELKPVPQPAKLLPLEPLVALYDKRGRLIVPPAMKGSHEVLVHQNVMADSDGLERIQDDEDLDHMRTAKLLVAIPETPGLQTDERLPANRRYTRPWTAAFLTALARAHYARFHSPLQVNSAVRTVEFQQRLLRTNGNAAPAEGATASPHLTGQAVDLAKHGLSLTEIAWLRGYLLPLVQEGKVDVEEEFQQACFHISVYKRYLPQAAPRREITPHTRSGASTLAVAIP